MACSKSLTLSEYYLSRAKFHAEQGKDYWLIDGITGEKRYFHKFDEETQKIGSAFYKLGLRKGDVVIYMIKDLCKIHILMTGVWRGNGVMRATYPEDDAETVLSRVKESNCKFIVCEEEATEMLKSVSQSVSWELNIITVNRTNPKLPSIQQFLEEDDGSDCPELLSTPEDPAIILCTSGTTGLPKGAVHTHSSYLYTLKTLQQCPFTLDKPNLCATKATHISAGFGFMIMGFGATSVMVSTLTAANIIGAAEKYKPGFAFAFPTFLVALAESHGNGHDLSSIEVIYTAGVSLTPAIRETLHKLPNLKDIVVAYGMTENLICTTTALGDGSSEARNIQNVPDFSVGKTYLNTQLQIRDPSTLQILGPNQQGEICVKSPAQFHSYLNNPEATKKSYIDDYFRTGDIGYVDNDGFVYIVDRLKEIFKYYNDHISPTELENVIGKHSKVSQVCVIGVADPGGHVPRAFITIQPNSGPKDEIIQDVLEYSNAKLAPYKRLRGGVYIVDELPKGKTGKVSRQLVEKLVV